MRIPVAEAVRQLDKRGLIRRTRHGYSERAVEEVRRLLGRDLPQDLIDFYRERIARLGDFPAFTPEWNDRVGWRTPDRHVTELLHVEAVPVLGDGCGNLFGLDISPGVETPAVYFFDHERGFEQPEYAAGSSLGTFLLLAGDDDRAFDEGWPKKWELTIDPDLEKCPRAPAIWAAG